MVKTPEPIHWIWLLPAAALTVGLWMENGWVLAIACVAGGIGLGFFVRYRAAAQGELTCPHLTPARRMEASHPGGPSSRLVLPFRGR